MKNKKIAFGDNLKVRFSVLKDALRAVVGISVFEIPYHKLLSLSVLACAIMLAINGCGISQRKYDQLSEEKASLEEKLNRIQKEKDAIKTDYDKILAEKLALRSSYDSVFNEKMALKSEYDKILQEKLQLAIQTDALMAEKNKLQEELNKYKEKKK